MSQSHKHILVLDANQRAALAVTRSLGQAPELTVSTADSTTMSLAGSSRYSHCYHQHPCATESPAEFLSWIESIIQQEKIDAVFPVTEVSSQLLAMNQSRLGNCTLPYANYATIMMLADKGKLVQLAQRVGVKTPETHLVTSRSELDPSTIRSFPIVLKPCLSKIWSGKWISTTVEIIHSAKELQQALKQHDYFEYPFLIQEFIPGHGAGVFTLYDQGEAKACFAHKRLREKPPSGGVSVLSESVSCEPFLLEQSKKLLDEVGWHGVAMVEFRVTPDGTAYLMEVNTRFWGSLQLSIDSGVDFPYLLYGIAAGEMVDPVTKYKEGQRLRWLLGDLDRLYLILRNRSEYSLKQKIVALAEFFSPGAVFQTRHEVNRFSDLKPALFELKQYISALLQNRRQRN